MANLTGTANEQPERRTGTDRRKAERRQGAVADYVGEERRSGWDRRHYIRREDDRASGRRRKYFMDIQRDRFVKAMQEREKAKKDNMLYSPKRVAISRKEAQKLLAQQAAIKYQDQTRTAKSLALTYGLEVNQPVQVALSTWQQQHEDIVDSMKTGFASQRCDAKASRRP